MKSSDSFSYQISWLASLLATHSTYEAISSETDGFQLKSGNTYQKISYLAIGNGIALESGIFWNVLAIHLENGEIIRVGGIRKKQSIRLQAVFNQLFRRYLNDFYRCLLPEIKTAYEQARVLFSDRYIRLATAKQWLETYQNLATGLQRQDIKRFLPRAELHQAKRIAPLLNQGIEAFNRLNESHITRQTEVFREFFDTIESNPLTPNQRRACIIDEKHNLVLAGAGTGKTSTMIGRAGYLIKAGLANPEQILMLAFARKAAEEMDERIQAKLGIENLTVKTFHSLGKHIIAQVEGRQPSIDKMAEDEHLKARFVDEQIQRLLQDEQYKSRIVTYFLYHSFPYRSVFEFKSLGEYNQYILENDIRTFQGELVKSYEECEIANFLYRQGIKYQYEANYQVNTSGPDYRVYQPDFYLPDYGIYIEHFAVDEKNQTPSFIPQQKYLEGMQWKRELHQKYNTCLIETYSYQKKQGILTESLEQQLRQAGVVFQPLPNNELLNHLNELGQVSLLSQLLAQILGLFKAAGLCMKNLVSLCQQHEDRDRMNAVAFLFEPIYEAYQQRLHDTETIDFDDMINRAIKYVEGGRYRSPYSYILVDEFQDISANRARLIKGLLAQRADSGLFCVGDDWQSIYRFTGSDVSITKEFEENFGETAVSVLDLTFRFNNKIGDVASRFITQNPTQIVKQIQSYTIIDQAAVSLIKTNDELFGLDAGLSAINTQSTDHASVLILARFNFKKPNLSELKRKYPKLNIRFMSVHASKGKEADYVIVIGLEKGKHGFPSEKKTHPILELLLPPGEAFPHAEERRLFYVALTRARHRVYLVCDANNTSDFVRELVNQHYEIRVDEFVGEGFQDKIAHIKCKECGVGYMVPRDGQYGSFFGCNQYPLCTHTETACQWCGSGLLEKGRFRVCENTLCDYVEPVCPRCNGKMTLRKGPYGQFWGCSHFRKEAEFSCNHTEKFIDLKAAKYSSLSDKDYIT